MDKNFLNTVLNKAMEFKTSDILFSSGLPPYIRNLGDVVKLEGFNPLSAKNIFDIAMNIMDKRNQELFLRDFQADFSYTNETNNTRYRVNAFRSHKGVSMVFRQLNTDIPKLEDLDFPPIFEKIASLDKGLILVCGPTGSGKSTTLATLIDYVNRNFKKHIITIEDPIEYIHPTKNSLVDQREVGKSVKSFSDGLRGALREDPDIILIGEMRDKETIKMALTAAETGHLVFSTLHTMSASKTIDRIIDSVEQHEKEVVRSMLSTSLQAVILQTLLKNSYNNGRVAAFEIAIGTGAVRNMIRENKVYQIDSMIQTGVKYGMITMKDYIENLMAKNLVDKTEALAKITKIDD